MTSIFKENSRFSVLIDNEPKMTRNHRNHRNHSSRENYNIPPRINNFSDKTPVIKEEKSKLDLIDTNFPSIGNVPIKINIKSRLDYIDLLTQSNNTEQPIVTSRSIENIDPGWVLLRRNKSTSKTIIRENNVTAIPEKTDYELAISTLNTLVSLYEKRTKEYIDIWGYDEWDQMFTFPNYDYDYFDRLDELEVDKLEAEQNLQAELDELDELQYASKYPKWN